LHQGRALACVFVMGNRGQEIPGVGQAIAANRPQIGQAQRRAVVLGNIAASLGIEQLNAKLEATGDHRDFQWFQIQAPQLGTNAQAAQFGHQQQLAISIEKHPLHRGIGAVMVDADARRFFRPAIGRHTHKAIDKICGLIWNRQRVPAQAIGCHRPQRATRQLPFELDERRVVG
jgi:formate dehydrogenase assembly factor FdhD